MWALLIPINAPLMIDKINTGHTNEFLFYMNVVGVGMGAFMTIVGVWMLRDKEYWQRREKYR